MSGKARAFCFTLPNYTEEDEIQLAKLYDKYLVYGKEECPTTGTKHLQGYIVFNNPRSFKAIAKKFKWHIEIAKGSADANFKYCTKSGVFVALGEPPSPGERSDIKEIGKLVREGDFMGAIDKCENFQQLKFAEGLRKYYLPNREFITEVRWYWGPTDCGKTRTIWEEVKADGRPWWTKLSKGCWFDSYIDQPLVILDDLRADWMKFHDLLNLFDRYPLKLEVKGGITSFMAEIVWVSSPYPPEELYKERTQEDLKQLLRRVKTVREFHGTEQRSSVILTTTGPKQIEDKNKWILPLPLTNESTISSEGGQH